MLNILAKSYIIAARMDRVFYLDTPVSNGQKNTTTSLSEPKNVSVDKKAVSSRKREMVSKLPSLPTICHG